jgi:hypothetical protein
MNQNRLFVGNLSYQTMENDLQDYFSQAGVVTSVNLMLDKVTGNLEVLHSSNSPPRRMPIRQSSSFTIKNFRAARLRLMWHARAKNALPAGALGEPSNTTRAAKLYRAG